MLIILFIPTIFLFSFWNITENQLVIYIITRLIAAKLSSQLQTLICPILQLYSAILSLECLIQLILIYRLEHKALQWQRQRRKKRIRAWRPHQIAKALDIGECNILHKLQF